MAFNDQISAVINKLHDVGGLKFGDYMMKSGRRSPIYVDLRVIISHPKLMVKMIHRLFFIYNYLNSKQPHDRSLIIDKLKSLSVLHFF
jgi:hypothetical protein